MSGVLARRGVAVAAVAAVLLFGSVGCSDDDSDAESDSGSDVTTTESTSGDDGSTTSSGGDDTGDEAEGSSTTTPAEGSGDDEAAAFCEELISYQDQSEMAEIDTESEPTEEEVAEFKETFQEQLDLLEQLVAEAPEDIGPDLQAQLDALAPVNDQVQAAEQPSDLIDAIATMAEAGEDPAVAERGGRIEEWVTQNCGEGATG